MIQLTVYSVFFSLLLFILLVIISTAYPFALLVYIKKLLILLLVVTALVLYVSTISIQDMINISLQALKTGKRMYKESPIQLMKIATTFMKSLNINKTLEYAQKHFDIQDLLSIYDKHKEAIPELIDLFQSKHIVFLVLLNTFVLFIDIIQKVLSVFIKLNKKIKLIIELICFVIFTGYYITIQESFDDVYVFILMFICILYSIYIGCLYRNIQTPFDDITPLNLVLDCINTFVIISHLISSIQ